MRRLLFILILLIFVSCENLNIVTNKENTVSALINGEKYVSKTIILDNLSDPNRFGFASTDLRDTDIELDFPKNEIQANIIYDLKNQPWDLEDKITLHFKQPDKIGHYISNATVKFTKISVDKYYEGEFEFSDDYYSNNLVNVTEGKFKIFQAK